MSVLPFPSATLVEINSCHFRGVDCKLQVIFPRHVQDSCCGFEHRESSRLVRNGDLMVTC